MRLQLVAAVFELHSKGHWVHVFPDYISQVTAVGRVWFYFRLQLVSEATDDDTDLFQVALESSTERCCFIPVLICWENRSLISGTFNWVYFRSGILSNFQPKDKFRIGASNILFPGLFLCLYDFILGRKWFQFETIIGSVWFNLNK